MGCMRFIQILCVIVLRILIGGYQCFRRKNCLLLQITLKVLRCHNSEGHVVKNMFIFHSYVHRYGEFIPRTKSRTMDKFTDLLGHNMDLLQTRGFTFRNSKQIVTGEMFNSHCKHMVRDGICN
jgi:hypothetical protein